MQVAEKAAWIDRRHRRRAAEVMGLLRNLRQEMNEMQSEESGDE